MLFRLLVYFMYEFSGASRNHSSRISKMTDNKINMSLQEIIDSQKKGRSLRVKRSFPKNGGVGRRNVNKSVTARSGVAKRISRNKGIGRTSVLLNSAATKRIVNNLVKKAMRQRANRSIIRGGNVRRNKVAASRIAAVRSGGSLLRRRRETVVARRLGLNQRSRTIRKRFLANRVVVGGNFKANRGRGRALGRLVSDISPVMQREMSRPRRRMTNMANRQVILEEESPLVRRVARPVRRVAQPVRINQLEEEYVEPIRPFQVRQRFVEDASPRYVYVSPAGRRNMPVTERIVMPRRRLQNNSGLPYYENSNRLIRMRDALGISSNRNVRFERFEPSSSFLQRIPVSTRRGRGFRDDRIFVR
ncbi:hypothetical protein AB6A40_006997 [Gnathostoma spinigerum]|uniref:Uncharacterized protein n=1 Tax=Gnathostoma spinigerum TaxID=75299 RepID=A0ABD6EJY5_9BILA